MSYSRLIDTNLVRAFNKLKDLAKIATVTKHTNVDFDFDTAEATSNSQTINFKVVLISSTRDSESKTTEQAKILYRKEDVGNLSNYDTIVIDGQTFKVGKVVRDNSYVALANLIKEL